MGKKASSQPPEVEKLPTFEVALEQLEKIVGRLEEGEIGLTESLADYEKGVRLLRQCYKLLDSAERRIELLSGVDAEGNAVTEPLHDEELSLDEKVERRSRRRSTDQSSPAAPPPPGKVDSDVDAPGGLF